MITDNAGLDTNSDKAADKNKVSEVLNAMAGKLQYTGYQNGERNLKGKLRIAEGLTSSSAGLRTESLSFKGDGQGYFDYTPAKPDKPEIETGDYETSIMSSTRSALTSSILVWRNDMNDSISAWEISESVRKAVCGQEPTAAGSVMTPTMRI